MNDNAWVQTLREAYLANEASVFLLHGATLKRSTADDVVSFLAGTREVVGKMMLPAALRFPGLGDDGRFERILGAQDLLDGHTAVLRNQDAGEALTRIWRALADTSLPQAYVLGPADRLAPARKKTFEELPEQTPQLAEWCSHPRIRQSNHIVVLLVSDLKEVHSSLREAAMTISLDGLPTQAAPESAPQVPVVDPPKRTPKMAFEEALIVELSKALQKGVLAALIEHDETHRPAGIPVMAAVAQVLGEKTGRPGPLQWGLDDDEVVVTGEGGADFYAAWQADIVLSASAGMLIKEWRPGVKELNPAALKALSKRVARLL